MDDANIAGLIVGISVFSILMSVVLFNILHEDDDE